MLFVGILREKAVRNTHFEGFNPVKPIF